MVSLFTFLPLLAFFFFFFKGNALVLSFFFLSSLAHSKPKLSKMVKHQYWHFVLPSFLFSHVGAFSPPSLPISALTLTSPSSVDSAGTYPCWVHLHANSTPHLPCQNISKLSVLPPH